MLSVTESLLLNEISTQLAKRRGAALEWNLAFRLKGRYLGSPAITVEDKEYLVRECRSQLEARILLNDARREGKYAVILTELPDTELGSDVVCRLYRRKLFEVNPWEVVKRRFRTTVLDPTLHGLTPLAHHLVGLTGIHEPPAGAQEVLDAETVWRFVFAHTLQLGPRPSVYELLQWGADGASGYGALDSELLPIVRSRLVESAGRDGELLLTLLEKRGSEILVPAALAVAQCYEEGVPRELLIDVTVDLWGRRLKDSEKEGASLGGAAREYLNELIAQWEAESRTREYVGSKVREYVVKADEILLAFGKREMLLHGRVSERGYEGLLEAYGRALAEFAKKPGHPTLIPIEELLAKLEPHIMFRLDERQKRVRMAARLARALLVVPRLKTFVEYITYYAQDGAFLDWARRAIRTDDAILPLREGMHALERVATSLREEWNRSFAEGLRDYYRELYPHSTFTPIERVLDERLRPIAQERQVLFLVLDGMSYDVCSELLGEAFDKGWRQQVPIEQHHSTPVLTMSPSVTEVARYSLLSGGVGKGTASTEKGAFAHHGGLVSTSKSKYPPVLFHKDELQSRECRDALLEPKQQIVGVVFNAVDDQLKGGAQISLEWGPSILPQLTTLLELARDTKRVVVLTSDHGHVLEYYGEYRKHEDGERYRRDDGTELDPREIRLEGKRVKTEWGDKVVVPWSEELRYALKRNGYHGGATLQEMVVPFIVLDWLGGKVPGFEPALPYKPLFWEKLPLGSPIREVKLSTKAKSKVKESDAQGMLFAPPKEEGRSLIDRLLASDLFKAQEKGLRTPLSEHLLRSFFEVMEERRWICQRDTLSNRLRLEKRTPGFLAQVRRLLNVDGYPVLEVDDHAETVKVDRDLLMRQFGLSDR